MADRETGKGLMIERGAVYEPVLRFLRQGMMVSAAGCIIMLVQQYYHWFWEPVYRYDSGSYRFELLRFHDWPVVLCGLIGTTCLWSGINRSQRRIPWVLIGICGIAFLIYGAAVINYPWRWQDSGFFEEFFHIKWVIHDSTYYRGYPPGLENPIVRQLRFDPVYVVAIGVLAAIIFCVWLGSSVLYCDALVRRRMKSVMNPTCRGCGYNLTGNVSGVCPECGQTLLPQEMGDEQL